MAILLHDASPMRAATLAILGLGLTTFATGCGEREPYNAYDVAAANQFQAQQREEALRHAPADKGANDGAKAKVVCRCDADGGLHVTAPPDARVTAREGEDAEAEISLDDRPPGTRLRRTVSLGYVGDGPLTQIPSRGGPWNVPDAILPLHDHVETRYPSIGYGGPYGYYGYRGYRHSGWGTSRGTSPASGGQVLSSGHNLHFPTHLSVPGVGGNGSSGGSRSGGRGPR